MSGELLALTPPTVASDVDPVDMVVLATGDFAYTVNFATAVIDEYSVDSGGHLAPLSTAFVTPPNAPQTIGATHDGQFVYAGLIDNTVAQFSVGVDGQLNPLTPDVVACGNGPTAISVSPNNAHAYVFSFNDKLISQYSIGGGGQLTPLSPATVSAGTDPEGMLIVPSGSFLYALDGLAGAVLQFSIGGGGQLTPLSPASVATGTSPFGIACDSTGAFLYVANEGDNTISQYSIGGGGQLTPLSPATISAGSNLSRLHASPTAANLYAMDTGGNVILQFSIGGSGQLTPLSPASVAIDIDAFFIVGSADGQFVYVGSGGAEVISQFQANVASDTIVPNVVAATYAQAVADIAASLLIVGNVVDQYSLTVPAGKIISQNPHGGTVVSVGSAVDVVRSLGAIVVPDVVGDSAAVANGEILAALLNVGPATGGISKLVVFGSVISQTPIAGSLALPGDAVSYVVSLPGNNFNVDKTVISQYANSPTLLQLIHNMQAYIRTSADLATFYQFVWNVDTAVGFGLDIWGKIVGVTRLLQIPGSDPIVGFDNPSTPKDWTPMTFGRFAQNSEATTAVVLQDGAYRVLILAKALANICAMTAPALNQLLRNLFPGRGRAYVRDLGNMAMQFVFNFTLTPVEYAILTQSGALPHPAGVFFSVIVNKQGLFGFQGQGPSVKPFNFGVFNSRP